MSSVRTKSPAFRFYPSDFMGSPDVQAMDLHEVGAYILLLCTAWQMERHGYLPDDDDRLRRWARMSRDQWTQSRDVLLAKFPVVEPGFRANSRMVTEAEKQAEYTRSQQEKGRKGGRPRKPQLSEKKSELVSEKPGVLQKKAGAFEMKAGVKPSVSVSVFASEDEKQKLSQTPSAQCEPPGSAEAFMVAWNENCAPAHSKVLKLTESRRRKIAQRLREGTTLEQFTEAVKIAARTPFLRGKDQGGWKCSFDFLIENDNNLTKVLEGRYSDAKATAIFTEARFEDRWSPRKAVGE